MTEPQDISLKEGNAQVLQDKKPQRRLTAASAQPVTADMLAVNRQTHDRPTAHSASENEQYVGAKNKG